MDITLYPPYIDSSIPSFTRAVIKIPFRMNPAIAIDDVYGFRIQCKKQSSSEVLGEYSILRTSDLYKTIFYSFFTNGVIEFKNKKPDGTYVFNDISIGQFYKFQVSYILNNPKSPESLYGKYSSIGVGKCIELPSVSIQYLTQGSNNINIGHYTGLYSTSSLSEPVYSYRFVVRYQTNKNIIADTGILLHDSTKDVITEEGQRNSKHEFDLFTDLIPNTIYQISFTITTVNGYQTTKTYNIINGIKDDCPIANGQIVATNNYDTGSITVELTGTIISSDAGNDLVTKYTKGNYWLVRKTEDNPTWEQLILFTIDKDTDLENFSITWEDNTVEYGKTYIYGIQKRISKKIAKDSADTYITYTKRIETKNQIQAFFEDMFLSDKDKCLKIKFNPKVSSFKRTILEQKTDTMGGRYPFIFRNGQVDYKEIGLSGLISYHMDDIEKFNSRTINLINLTDDNFLAERKFREEVYTWLTNGDSKLFRSPAEGNYIIRLMNISLQPNEQLSRMLYTFNATGYEIQECTMQNILSMGLTQFPGEYKKLTTAARGIKLMAAINNDGDEILPEVNLSSFKYVEGTLGELVDLPVKNMPQEGNELEAGDFTLVFGRANTNTDLGTIVPLATLIQWDSLNIDEYSKLRLTQAEKIEQPDGTVKINELTPFIVQNITGHYETSDDIYFSRIEAMQSVSNYYSTINFLALDIEESELHAGYDPIERAVYINTITGKDHDNYKEDLLSEVKKKGTIVEFISLIVERFNNSNDIKQFTITIGDQENIYTLGEGVMSIDLIGENYLEPNPNISEIPNISLDTGLALHCYCLYNERMGSK